MKIDCSPFPVVCDRLHTIPRAQGVGVAGARRGKTHDCEHRPRADKLWGWSTELKLLR